MEMRKRKNFTSLIFMALTSCYLLDGLEFKRKFGVLKSKRTKKGKKKHYQPNGAWKVTHELASSDVLNLFLYLIDQLIMYICC